MVIRKLIKLLVIVYCLVSVYTCQARGAPPSGNNDYVKILSGLNKFMKAQKFKGKKIEIEAQDERPFMDIALMQYDLGNYDEALKEFLKVYKLNPKNAEALYHIALIYERKLDFKLAVEFYNKAKLAAPGNKKIKDSYNRLLEKIIKDVNEDIKENPELADNYKLMGFVYMYKEDYDKAEKYLKKAIKLNPELSEAYNYLGVVYMKKGRLKQAYRWIEKAFQMDSSNKDIYHNFRVISEKIMNSEEALDITPIDDEDLLSTTSSTTPENQLDFHLKMAKIKEKEKKISEALNHYHEALALDHTNEFIRKKIVELTKILKQKNNINNLYEKATQLIRTAEEKLNLNKVNEATEAYKQAYRILKNILPSYKEKVLVLAKLVEVLFKLQMYEEAKTYLYRLNAMPARNLSRLGNKLCYFLVKEARFRLQDGEAKKASDILNIINSRYSAYLSRNPLLKDEVKAISMKLSINKGKKYLIYGVPAIILLLVLLWLLLTREKRKINRLFKELNTSMKFEKFEHAVKAGEELRSCKIPASKLFEIDCALAEAYLKLKDYKKAIAAAKRVEKVDANNRLAHEVQCQAFLKEGIINEESVKEYRYMLQYDYNNIELLRAVVAYYIKKCPSGVRGALRRDIYKPEVIDIFRRLLKAEPHNVKALKFLAQIYTETKNTDSMAIKVYEEVLKFEPQNMDIHRMLAKAYSERGKDEKASKVAAYILMKEPDNMLIHKILQDSLISLSKFEDLIEIYEKLAERFKSSRKIQDMLNRLKREYGDKLKLKEVISEEVNIDEQYKKGLKLFREGKYNEAIQFFEVAFYDVNYRNRACHKLLACYVKLESFNKAKFYYERLRVREEMIGPELKEILYEMGRLFEDKGDFTSALEIYNRICKVDIGYKDVFDRFEEIYRFVYKGTE